jgi:hypothetical protein
MNQIKAIETTYKGYRFRSRLEARWAVFFDTLGIPWKYENEGYQKEVDTVDGIKNFRYLPDFFLPCRWGKGGMFVEVKGNKDGLKIDWEHNAMMHDWGSILPDFANSVGKSNAGLLLLTEVPEASPNKIYFHPVLQHNKGLIKSYGFFGRDGLSVIDDSPLAELLDVKPVYNLDSSGDDWGIDTKYVTADRHYPHVVKAYASARGARFEHGEGQPQAKPVVHPRYVPGPYL